MNKKKGIIFFIISIVIILVCCFCTVFGFGPTHTGSAENIVLGLDLRGGTSVTYEIQDEEFDQTDVDDTIYKLQLRLAEFSTDASVYKEGDNRITVEIPGVYDEQKVINELGRPGSLQFVTYDETNEDGTVDYSKPKVWVTGSQVASAEPGYQQNSKTGGTDYVVSLAFNSEGAEAFGEATSTHIGKSIYIIYDDEVVSYPVVQSAITNGSCVIEGLGSYETASTLASTIRIGSLNLTLKDISSKVVSAKLGDDAVSTSLIAGAIGLALIIIFMCIYYKVPGIAASIALIFYTAAILLLMNAFDMTLTISGIAGIILTIGMAVDGNVIINTRIKEELQAGRSAREAIKQGFKKSASAIMDGNITTFIVAIVLIIFGSGTVQGFGQTLAIGIVLSVITSLLISRLLVTCLYEMGLKDSKHYARLSRKKRKIFDFIGKKVIWFVIAAVCVLAGIVTMLANSASGKNAFNLSIEFAGGVSTQVEFNEDISIDDFNNEIKPEIEAIIGSSDIEGQKTTGSNIYVIKTPEISVENRDALKELLINKFDAKEDSFQFTAISSTISNELTRDAVISMIIAAVCMLIYIWIRFRRFRFAISSVIALCHDVLIVMGFYAIFRLSVGNSFIACILTIVGYSINATIVIFDRIRENLRDNKINYDLKKVVNLSIQQTLTRSILTSATTFIMVLFLDILGVESMRAFSMPLGVGVIAGAFSSVFISGSLYYIMTKKKDRYNAAGAAKAEKAAKAALASGDAVIDVPVKEVIATEVSVNEITVDENTDSAEVLSEVYENANEEAVSAPEDTSKDVPGTENMPQKITANPNKKKKKKRKQ